MPVQGKSARMPGRLGCGFLFRATRAARPSSLRRIMPEKPDESSPVHYGLPKQPRFPKWATAVILIGIVAAIIAAFKLIRG